MSDKVTTMVLKVDLECHRCYKKVKKVLSKFSEIRDQVYDEKQNTVTIKVLSSKPEKLRDKIRYKGGESIVSIEIKEPEKKKEPEKPKESEQGKKKEPEKEKPKESEQGKKKEPDRKGEKKKEEKKEEEKPKPEKPAGEKPEKAKAADPPKEGPSPPKGSQPALLAGYPPPYSFVASSAPWYGGGGPAPASYQNGNSIGVPIYDSYGGGVSRFDYFSEENPSACVVM